MATAQLDPATVDLLDVHARVGQATRKFVMGITPAMWTAPTNCDMDARALVNHIVTGHDWATELTRGKTIADVGSSLDGDVLGTDPLAAYAGQGDRLDPELAAVAYAMFEPHAAEFAASGAFGTRVVVPEASDAQTKLLAMLGRDTSGLVATSLLPRSPRHSRR